MIKMILSMQQIVIPNFLLLKEAQSNYYISQPPRNYCKCIIFILYNRQ